MTSLRLPLVAAAALLAVSTACGGEEVDEDFVDEDEAAQTTKTGQLTVEGASARSCSTSSVRGLSEQLVKEVMCLQPTLLGEIRENENIAFEPEVFPYLQADAARALEAGVAAYGKKLTLTSALRTLPQQYLLRRWGTRKRCGVRVAAAVGESNHEPGLAVDIKLLTSAENKKLRAALAEHKFIWIGAFDPVHFDYKNDQVKADDIGKLSVVAFKRLWNRNNPNARDQLPVDEKYDRTVEAKLKLAPAEGFPLGADCSDLER